MAEHNRKEGDPQPRTPSPMWTVDDVAEFLRTSRSYVYHCVGRNELPCRRVGSLLRFRPSEIRIWVDRQS